jgi:WhiB family redox-sensing transcriptional regulator
MSDSPMWHRQAACLGHPLEWWFPGKEDGGKKARWAKRICGRCAVRRECLAFALRTQTIGHEHGIWGGLGGSQLRPLLQAQARAESMAHE